MIGGWSLNGIYTFQSGEPFTVRSGFLTANNVGQNRAALAPGVMTLAKAQLQRKAGVAGPVFFPGARMFANPGPGQLGMGRNIFQGRRFGTWTWGLRRDSRCRSGCG